MLARPKGLTRALFADLEAIQSADGARCDFLVMDDLESLRWARGRV